MKKLLSLLAVLLLSTQVFATGLTPLPYPRIRFFDANGVQLSNGLVYTYACGTSTPVTTYTDSTGASANTNPVQLDSTGAAAVWYSGCIKVNVTDYNSVQQPGYPVDNIQDIGSFITGNIQWQATNLTPTYLSATQFSVPGIATNTFTSGTRLQLVVGGGTIYGSSLGASYGSGVTTVTVGLDSGSLNGISSVSVGILTVGNPSIPVLPVNVQTGNYTLTTADNNKTVELNSASTATFTLPAANAVPSGFAVQLRDIGAGQLIFGGTVNGVSNPVLSQNGSVTLFSDGAIWANKNGLGMDPVDRNANPIFGTLVGDISSNYGASSPGTATVNMGTVTDGDAILVTIVSKITTTGSLPTYPYISLAKSSGTSNGILDALGSPTVAPLVAMSATQQVGTLSGVFKVYGSGTLVLGATLTATGGTNLLFNIGIRAALIKKQ